MRAEFGCTQGVRSAVRVIRGQVTPPALLMPASAHTYHTGLLYQEESCLYTCGFGKGQLNSGRVFADTEKPSEKVKSVVGLSFIVTFCQSHCSPLSEEKMQILKKPFKHE